MGSSPHLTPDPANPGRHRRDNAAAVRHHSVWNLAGFAVGKGESQKLGGVLNWLLDGLGMTIFQRNVLFPDFQQVAPRPR
jgi:hypothetical protein